MRECGEAKVKGAIIISAGGKEVGEEGARIEEEIRSEAKRGRDTLPRAKLHGDSLAGK